MVAIQQSKQLLSEFLSGQCNTYNRIALQQTIYYLAIIAK